MSKLIISFRNIEFQDLIDQIPGSQNGFKDIKSLSNSLISMYGASVFMNIMSLMVTSSIERDGDTTTVTMYNKNENNMIQKKMPDQISDEFIDMIFFWCYSNEFQYNIEGDKINISDSHVLFGFQKEKLYDVIDDGGIFGIHFLNLAPFILFLHQAMENHMLSHQKGLRLNQIKKNYKSIKSKINEEIFDGIIDRIEREITQINEENPKEKIMKLQSIHCDDDLVNIHLPQINSVFDQIFFSVSDLRDNLIAIPIPRKLKSIERNFKHHHLFGDVYSMEYYDNWHNQYAGFFVGRTKFVFPRYLANCNVYGSIFNMLNSQIHHLKVFRECEKFNMLEDLSHKKIEQAIGEEYEVQLFDYISLFCLLIDPDIDVSRGVIVVDKDTRRHITDLDIVISFEGKMSYAIQAKFAAQTKFSISDDMGVDIDNGDMFMRQVKGGMIKIREVIDGIKSGRYEMCNSDLFIPDDDSLLVGVVHHGILHYKDYILIPDLLKSDKEFIMQTTDFLIEFFRDLGYQLDEIDRILGF